MNTTIRDKPNFGSIYSLTVNVCCVSCHAAVAVLTEGVEFYLFLNFLFCYYFRIHQRRRPVKGVSSSQKKCRMRVTSKENIGSTYGYGSQLGCAAGPKRCVPPTRRWDAVS